MDSDREAAVKLRQAAEAVAERLPGLTPEAVAALEADVKADRTLLAYAVRCAAYDALRAANHKARQELLAAAAPPTVSPERQQAIEAGARGYLSWPLMDGTPLGDADKEHLLSDAARHRQYAAGNVRSAKFYEALAARMRAGEKVKDVWEEEAVGRLLRKAQGRAEPEEKAARPRQRSAV